MPPVQIQENGTMAGQMCKTFWDRFLELFFQQQKVFEGYWCWVSYQRMAFIITLKTVVMSSGGRYLAHTDCGVADLR